MFGVQADRGRFIFHFADLLRDLFTIKFSFHVIIIGRAVIDVRAVCLGSAAVPASYDVNCAPPRATHAAIGQMYFMGLPSPRCAHVDGCAVFFVFVVGLFCCVPRVLYAATIGLSRCDWMESILCSCCSVCVRRIDSVPDSMLFITHVRMQPTVRMQAETLRAHIII